MPKKSIWPKVVFGFLVVLLIGLLIFIFMPLIPSRSRAESTQEMANLNAIRATIKVYSVEHDNVLPDHIADVTAIENEYLTMEDANWIFRSPYDAIQTRVLQQTRVKPEDWYRYGSYFFYPTAGINEGSIQDPAQFILAYGPSHNNPPTHRAIFLDGHFASLTENELHKLIDNQDTLISVE